MTRRRIYIAGAYEGPTLFATFANMRRGLVLGYRMLKAGYAPFVPWLAWTLSLIGPIEREEYLAYSMAWLEVAEAVLVVPRSENSRGTAAEIARAEELGKPVFYSRGACDSYFRLKEPRDAN